MSDSNSESRQSTSQQDNRNVVGEGALVAQSGASVTQIDNSTTTTLDATVANNAIKSSTDAAVTNLKQSLSFGSGVLDDAFLFGGKVLSQNAESENRVLDAMTASAGQVKNAYQQSSEMVKSAYAEAKGRGELTDKILIGAIAMAGLVAFAAVKGK